MITVITPTGDRPEAFKLCEYYLRRQTYRGPLQWIVVDDGKTPTEVTMGQEYVRREPSDGFTQAQNLLAAIPLVRGDYVLIMEDDDWYSPEYIEAQVGRLNDGLIMAGEKLVQMYNVRFRTWREHITPRIGPAMCGLAFRRELLSTLRGICERQVDRLDEAFWPAERAQMFEGPGGGYLLGIKGMPGRAGWMNWHRERNPYKEDPTLFHLRFWIGCRDAEKYAGYYVKP